jgi:hypothetical protein
MAFLLSSMVCRAAIEPPLMPQGVADHALVTFPVSSPALTWYRLP